MIILSLILKTGNPYTSPYDWLFSIQFMHHFVQCFYLHLLITIDHQCYKERGSGSCLSHNWWQYLHTTSKALPNIKSPFKGAQAWDFFALVFCSRWTHLDMGLRDWGKKSNFLSIDPWFWWFLVFCRILSVR